MQLRSTVLKLAKAIAALLILLLLNGNGQAQDKVRPFFKKNCIRCHGPDREEGGLRVDKLTTSFNDHESLDHLQNILDEMTTDSMPPADEPQPDPDELDEVCKVLTRHLAKARQKHNAGGGKPVRRLSRSEYVNTVYDLLNVKIDPDTLPRDTSIGSFDTNAETLYLTDLHFENYLRASREAVREFIAGRYGSDGPGFRETKPAPKKPKKGKKKNKLPIQPEIVAVPNDLSYEFFKDRLSGNVDQPRDNDAKKIIHDFGKLISRGRETDQKFLFRLNSIFVQGRQQGEPFWEAIVEPMALAMCSIESLMHLESNKSKTNRITGVDLANRMSYFLWRSAPDEELIALGKSGELLQSKIRAQQVDRMMDSEKFERFLRDFSDQWLELERQEQIAVDKRLFPDFEEQLKSSMREETVQFVSHVIRENLPLSNLIDSDFMVLNEDTAQHYGVEGVSGQEFRSVKRGPGDVHRGGILTHAGILMQTSTGDRTSIVERGVFISRKMLNDEPPPPPPNVAALETENERFARMTGAELVKAHASSRQCASCHNKIDPLGVGLEEFDVIGLHRTVETRVDPNFFKPKKSRKNNNNRKQFYDVPLETRGKIFNKRTFQGIDGLKKALLTHQDLLSEAYIEALLSFANGRKSGVADRTIVEDISKRAAKVKFPARSILKAVLYSEAFTSKQ